MAVFALIGGALLFTHVHSAAPYANVAVGVYFHHTVMGFIALLIGGIKLLDDLLSKPARWRTLAYPALMCLESVFLINYNEGLPWFMGFGQLSTVAAHGGQVAPFGPYRAEMVYSPDTHRLEVFLMNQSDAGPLRLTADHLDAVVRVGDSATGIALTPNPGGEPTSAHYAGKVGFLRNEPTFQFRASAAVGGRVLVADFEPWIEPALLVPPAKAKYVCPMHHQIGSDTTGACPLCSMPLQPNRPPRPYGILHDPEYKLEVLAAPSQVTSGQNAILRFTPRLATDERIVPKLAVVHTKPMHLIVVSENLSYFDHVHPDLQPDGSLVLVHRFPYSGKFLLFADITPADGANQVFRIPISVDGKAQEGTCLSESPVSAKLIDGYRVELTSSPRGLRAGDEAILSFRISRDNLPVSDLEQLLGASGHCVILSEDTKCYLHSHPAEASGAPGKGPEVQFHTTFPRPGLYKLWGQFSHKGKTITADFVVRVN